MSNRHATIPAAPDAQLLASCKKTVMTPAPVLPIVARVPRSISILLTVTAVLQLTTIVLLLLRH